MFICGRMSKRSQFFERLATSEAGVQKDDPIVLQRWREIAKAEAQQAGESKAAAREAQSALNLQIQEIAELRSLVECADQLLEALVRELERHSHRCPCGKEIFVVRKGKCWHMYGCHILEQAVPSNVQSVQGCSFCTANQCPPDRYEYPAGWCIRHDILAWRQDASPFLRWTQERSV